MRYIKSVYTLSSGTIGAALEGVLCKQKALAISFAIFSRDFGGKEIQGSCEMGKEKNKYYRVMGNTVVITYNYI